MLGEIISVGDELLEGRIVNDNTAFLSRELTSLGVEVTYHQTVGDHSDCLQACFELALSRAKIIILTGGLGPTRDDITKESVAKVLGKELVFNDTEYRRIKSFFDRLGRSMSENNMKQAYLPRGAEILTNDVGTASGVLLEQNDKVIVLLPGPPREMQYIFTHKLRKRLVSKMEAHNIFPLNIKTLKLIGIGESQLDELLERMELPEKSEIIPMAKHHQVHLIVKSGGENAEQRDRDLKQIISQLYREFGTFIWGEDDQELEHLVMDKLKSNNKTVAVAESMTGGMLAGVLTDVPGASEVLLGGITAYTETGKSVCLNIDQDFLDNHEHVSESTSRKLAEQVKKQLRADIGIGITGYAGPDDENKGLFHAVVLDDNNSRTLSRKLPGRRIDVKRGAVFHTLNELRKFMSD